MRNAWGSSEKKFIDGSKRVVRVKIPDIGAVRGSTFIAKQIRNNILRDEFDYTETQIEAFNVKYPNTWIIVTLSTPNVWTTDHQIKKWLVETDGLVPIVLENDWVNAVESFRNENINFALSSVYGEISDADLAGRIIWYLEKILYSYENERINAFNSLLGEIAAQPEKSKQIADALSYISAQGYGKNPFITIALARAYQISGDAPDIIVLTMLAKTNQLINENYDNPSKSKINNFNRLEAAAIYGQMRSIYGQFGAATQENQADWRYRFLQMGEERNNFKEGDMIEIIEPGNYAFTAPSVNDRELMDVEEKEAKRRLLQAQTGQMPNMPKSDDNPGQLTSSDKVYVATEDKYARQKNRQKYGKNYVEKFKRVDNPDRVINLYNTDAKTMTLPEDHKGYDSRTLRSPGTPGNVIYVVAEVLKFYAIHRQMMELAEYWDKKRELQRAIHNDKYRLVPPKPQKVQDAIRAVRDYARTSANPSDKDKAIMALQALNIILEDSRAFWGK